MRPPLCRCLYADELVGGGSRQAAPELESAYLHDVVDGERRQWRSGGRRDSAVRYPQDLIGALETLEGKRESVRPASMATCRCNAPEQPGLALRARVEDALRFLLNSDMAWALR